MEDAWLGADDCKIMHDEYHSYFGVEVLGVLFGVECELVVVECLSFDTPILEEDDPIAVALQVLIVRHHHHR